MLQSNLWEELVASSKLASGIGKKTSCNLRNIGKKPMKKSIKF